MRQGAERQREERRESRADQGKSDGDSAVLDRGSRNSQALDVGRYRIARDQGYRLPSWHSVQVQVAGGQGRTGQGWLGTYCLAAADRGTLIYVCMHAIMGTVYSRKSCESRESLLDTTYQPTSLPTVERAGGFISAACCLHPGLGCTHSRDGAVQVGAMPADSTAMRGQRSRLHKRKTRRRRTRTRTGSHHTCRQAH